MIMLILKMLLAIGGPAIQIALRLIPSLLEYKLLKAEEAREIERRFKEAIRLAEEKSRQPSDVKTQYDSAKDAAMKKWNNEK